MPAPVTLTFDLLTLKMVSESHVTWATQCANFNLHRPLCSRRSPMPIYPSDRRQTSDSIIA